MRGLAVVAIAVTALVNPVAADAPSADEVVAVEREFAADAQARGWIAAFKKYAAPEGIWLQPDPGNAQAALAKEPDEPANRSLKWWPIWAGVAASGDIGFTSGPYTVGGNRYGHYFTVWAKQTDGSWRWIFDGGPRNDAASPFGPETTPLHLPVATSAAGSADKAWADVEKAEASLAASAEKDSRQAYVDALSPDARVMGSPAQPAVGAAKHPDELARRAPSIAFKQLGGRASRAGDMVFTYGEATWRQEGDQRRGHYVRIWQRRGEDWKIVFDELIAVPPPKP